MSAITITINDEAITFEVTDVDIKFNEMTGVISKIYALIYRKLCGHFDISDHEIALTDAMVRSSPSSEADIYNKPSTKLLTSRFANLYLLEVSKAYTNTKYIHIAVERILTSPANQYIIKFIEPTSELEKGKRNEIVDWILAKYNEELRDAVDKRQEILDFLNAFAILMLEMYFLVEGQVTGMSKTEKLFAFMVLRGYFNDDTPFVKATRAKIPTALYKTPAKSKTTKDGEKPTKRVTKKAAIKKEVLSSSYEKKEVDGSVNDELADLLG